MKADQIEIILQYLKIETNYAVIINGRYGVGKTHFYKFGLVPEITNLQLPKDATKTYRPIHISLFGLKSIEEIQTAIFVELFAILKDKKTKLSLSIAKTIFRGIANFTKAGDIDKYVGDINSTAVQWIKYDELVICFDDLDRKSDSLDLRDILGFVNSLVENEGAKILIIANEESLFEIGGYKEAREKVVGVSMEYIPDAQSIFQQIIKNRYSGSNQCYYDLVKNSEQTILNAIEINHNNFRNLIFFLEHFKIIFYPIQEILQRDKNFAIKKDEKIAAILNFTLAITIEYKIGTLNSGNFSDLEKVKPDISTNYNPISLSDGETDVKETYIKVFIKKYFEYKRYYFFKSIFDYVTGISAFYVDRLQSELDVYFIVQDGKITEQQEILEQLSYSDYHRLNDKEYRRLTRKMLSFVDTSGYQLQRKRPVKYVFTKRCGCNSFVSKTNYVRSTCIEATSNVLAH